MKLMSTALLPENIYRQLSDRCAQANASLLETLDSWSLVQVDRFTSSGRNYLGEEATLWALRPALTLGCYEPWREATVAQKTLALETRLHVRGTHSKHAYLEQLGEDARAALAALPHPPLVAAWYETSEIRSLVDGLGGKLLTAKREVREIVEDKSRLNELLASAGIEAGLQIASIRVEGRAPAFNELANRLGLPLVVQVNSSGGRGTLFVSNEQDFTDALALGRPLRISEFVPGFSSNTTVLTIANGKGCQVYVDQPSHKAMHVREVGIGNAKGAGNDWSIPFEYEGVNALVESAVRLGEYLFETYGLVGLWGIDTIWNGNQVVINEINCRNQGTTEVSGINQILRGVPPFVVSHLALHAGTPVSWLPNPDQYNAQTIQGASHPSGLRPFYLKIRNRMNLPVVTSPDLPSSGVYRLEATEQLKWLHPAGCTYEANFDENEVLVANLPGAATLCLPGAELCTLEGLTTNRSIFDGPYSLSPYGEMLTRAIYKHFIPDPDWRS
jgi:D-alanine-D-alanine ligase-like ATP-grasp enzyme